MKLFFYLIGLSFSFFNLQAEVEKEDSLIINSGEAHYDGKEMSLIGQVTVQHSLGQITTKQLSLLPLPEDKKNKFSILKLKNDIQIEFQGGGKLFCQQAEINYIKMQGSFSGNSSKPDVIYVHRDEKARDSNSLEIKSLQMVLDLVKEPSTSSKSTKTFVKQIRALQNVRIFFDQDYVVLSDEAIYQRLPSSTNASSGLITLTVEDGKPGCQLTNINEDYLLARSVQIQTTEKILTLDSPKGLLSIDRHHSPAQTLHFSASSLVWNEKNQTLHLKDHVHLDQNQVFHIQTDQEMLISQMKKDGKRTLRFISSPQNTMISYLDSQKNSHQIYCPGKFFMDHEHQMMILQGTLEQEEKKHEVQQVYIEDILGEMYANQVSVYYQWMNKQWIPEKILLDGKVKLLNRFDGHLEEAGAVLHYALADQIEYYPKTKEVLLRGNHENRVLFFDKINNVQMSAPSLKIYHDQTTGKESIQGLGDVRFTFIEKELEQLKHRFHLEESAHKELNHGKPNQ